MNRKSRIVFPVLGFGIFLTSLQAQTDRAHQLASQAGSQHPASCPKSGMTLQKCHNSFPAGCSAASHPGYDAYLDFLKDQDPGSALTPTKDLAAADFTRLEAQLP